MNHINSLFRFEAPAFFDPEGLRNRIGVISALELLVHIVDLAVLHICHHRFTGHQILIVFALANGKFTVARLFFKKSNRFFGVQKGLNEVLLARLFRLGNDYILLSLLQSLALIVGNLKLVKIIEFGLPRLFEMQGHFHLPLGCLGDIMQPKIWNIVFHILFHFTNELVLKAQSFHFIFQIF
ncbi:hypothetical protein D9M68_673760 [compost metagenome]